MSRALPLTILLSLLLVATGLEASSLSVVRLAQALQKPELAAGDRASESYRDAVNAVRDMLLNRPAAYPVIGHGAKPGAPALNAEQDRFCTRLTALAKYRDTRVGKLFFAALEATPAIDKLSDKADFAAVDAAWPLALDATARVRVEWSRKQGQWLISALAVTLDGLAAAPVSGMAPYFGEGTVSQDMLDLGPIDYLLGRDPHDRELPESERPAFDYDKAIAKLFAAEDGAYGAVVNELRQKVTPKTDRATRLEALTPHLAPQEAEAARAANKDVDRRGPFWENIYTQLKQAAARPMPASMPTNAGARVKIRYRIGHRSAGVAAERLDTGRIALSAEQEQANGEQGNGSGN